MMSDEKIDANSVDEIVIVVPEEAVKDGELEIDLDELGIDVDELGEEVNIVIQVEGAEELDEELLEDEDLDEPNEWQFDDDPYNVVYYEFPYEDDEE
jgi:hypothetical protein